MNFTRIHYTGTKPYRDKATGYTWTPDEIKLVTEKVAKALCGFVEFSRVTEGAAPEQEAATPSLELEQAMQEQQQDLQRDEQEHSIKENMLLTLESMNKGALIEYAAKYDTVLPSTKKVTELRLDVANLIEQFGAR